jgi:inhibitor of cysteine peptidase
MRIHSSILAATLALSLTVGAVGCSSDDSADTTTTAPTTTAVTTTTAAEGTVIDSPGPVQLGVGETATLVLEANPTTGYQWEPAAAPDSAVVTIVSDTYVAPDSTAMGAAGSQRIVIKGVAAGTTTLELRYVRPWETDVAPAETASYDITVA